MEDHEKRLLFIHNMGRTVQHHAGSTENYNFFFFFCLATLRTTLQFFSVLSKQHVRTFFLR